MREQGEEEEEEVLPLFETKEARFGVVYKLFACTIFAGICLMWVYRLTNIPHARDDEQAGRWAWIVLFMSELAFGFYWIITQSVRWRIVYQNPFKHRLLHRLINY